MTVKDKPLQRRRFVRLAALLGTALLMALALVPNFIRCRCQSSLALCKGNLKNIGTALEMYSVDRGVYPDGLAELAPNYLKTIPKCSTGKPYRAEIGPRGAYQVSCAGGWHGSGRFTGTHSTASHPTVKTAPGSPAFTSATGLLDDKILFRSDEIETKSEEYVEACKNLLAGTVGILCLLAILFELRRRQRIRTSALIEGPRMCH